MSSIKVDPAKLEELSAMLKKLSGTIGDREQYLFQDITQLTRELRGDYPEREVQRALDKVDAELQAIRKLASSVTSRLTKKSDVLIQAATIYRRDEEKAKKTMKQKYAPPVPSSYYIKGGGLSGEGLKDYLDDPLFQDPVVQKLHELALKGTEEEQTEAKKKLDEIFKARNSIARAQVAYAVYKAFGNIQLMNNAHKEAMKQREILKGYGISEDLYKEGVDLTALYKGSKLEACSYDPSFQLMKDDKFIPVLLPQDNQYHYLLGLIMEGGSKGAWAQKQLDEIHEQLKEIGRAQVAWGEYKAKNMKHEMDGAHEYAEKLRRILKEKYSLSSEMVDGVDFKYLWTGVGAAGKFLEKLASGNQNSEVAIKLSDEVKKKYPNQAAFIEKIIPAALRISKATGVPWQAIVAQTCYETGYGKSTPEGSNNFHGIKYTGSLEDKDKYVIAWTKEHISPNELESYKKQHPELQVLGKNDKGKIEVKIKAAFCKFENIDDSFKEYQRVITNKNFKHAARSKDPIEFIKDIQSELPGENHNKYGTDVNYAKSVTNIMKMFGLLDISISPSQTENSTNIPNKNDMSSNIIDDFKELKKNLNEVNEDVKKLQKRLNELGYRLQEDGRFGDKTEDAVNDFKKRNGLGNSGASEGVVGKQTWQTLFGTGAIGAKESVSSIGSTKPNINQSSGSQSTKGFIELSKEGPGYKRQGGNITAWGTPSSVESFMSIAKKWSEISDKLIYYNDLSQRNGGDHPNHKSHETGTDIDIRPIRKDMKNEGGITWKSKTYDRDATRKLIEIILEDPNVESIYFNDPVLIKEFGPRLKKMSGHDNHLHINFKK